MDALVAHYHEIGLKGRNRQFFEDALTRNLRRALRGTGYRRVRRGFGRITADFDESSDVHEAGRRAARLPGVAYVGVGHRVEPDMDAIGATALQLLDASPFTSYRVRARRTHSSFPKRSRDVNVVVGQVIKDATGAPVDLTHADATIWVELFGSAGIVYRDRLEGPGGLPVGVSGRMLSLLSGGIDSPVAAWRMMLRGAEVELLHFHGQPYTDPSSVRQACELAEVLARYQLSITLHLVPLADAQREIVVSAPSDLRVVLYRRAMMRIAVALATQREATALVTGDALGQVASQTVQNLHTIDASVPGAQVLRPLIGMDKLEIIDAAQRLETFDISTRKYQDCCVLFEPRSPATRTYPELAERAEAALDIEAMVGKALAGIETRVFELPMP
jgi:thiamine biosynthesis protein ThiI